MAETIFRGPGVVAGSLMDNSVGPFDGPSITYQADSFPDVRQSPMLKDGLSPGRIVSFFNSPYVVMVDAIPSPVTVTTVASGQNFTASTLLALNGTCVGGFASGTPCWTPNVPILPLNQSAIVTVSAIDFGFTTGTTVVNSSTVVVKDATLFNQGQWILIGGAGNAARTQPLFTQVQTTLNATTINCLPVALGSVVFAPIGSANLYSQLGPPSTQFGPNAPTPTAYQPYSGAGIAAIFNPLEAITRAVSVKGNTTIATGQVIVSGYDIYGAAMTELLTMVGTTQIFGNKAFKYIASVTSQQLMSNVVTASIGLSDVFGMALRNDRWENGDFFYNGTFSVNNNGWTAAFTGVSTNTTGDVRGTIQVSTAGNLGTSIVAALTNGTTRLAVMLSVPLWNMINANSNSSVSLYGVKQA